MAITLTWDLLLIVLMTLVTTYSYILGREESVRIIIATFLSLSIVLLIRSIVSGAFTTNLPLLPQVSDDQLSLIILASECLLFLGLLLMFCLKSGIDIHYKPKFSGWIDIVSTGILGLSSSFLLIAAILSFVTGIPPFAEHFKESSIIISLMQQSTILWLICSYRDLFIALPPILLLVGGFL